MNLKNLKNSINPWAWEDLALFLALISISGALIYYLYRLNTIGLIISGGLALIFFIVLQRIQKKYREKNIKIKQKKTEEEEKRESTKISILLPLFYFSLWLINFLILVFNRSDRPLISPWEVVPDYFWLTFTALSILLVYILLKKKLSSRLNIAMISGHYLLSFSVALIVYKINYGFDPFIHQASLELIAQDGFIAPKTPYYLGFYSLVIFLHKIFNISIYWLNRSLVPIMAGLFIPAAIFAWLKTKEDIKNQNLNYLTVLALLIIPFPIFILSTPQNLAFLFLLLTIVSSLKNKNNWPAPLVFGLASLAIHPLAGLAALGWLAFLFFEKYRLYLTSKIQKITKKIIFIALCLSWPLALYYFAGGSLKLNGFKELLVNLNFPSSFFPNQVNLFLDFNYFFFFNYPLLIFILIAIGWYKHWKAEKKDHHQTYLILSSLGILIAWLLSNLISFGSLISYEQGDYPRRLLIIFLIFNIPFIINSLLLIFTKIIKLEKPARLIWLTIIVLFLSASLYNSYPRRDNYFNSRGYAVGRGDLEAVNLISNWSDSNYIVLANQQTSAAALKELGFDNYYQSSQGPIYFYPIPTGGPLYQFYLDMVYKKTQRETMLLAMDLAGVDEGYFVINKYWLNSKKIIENAKADANEFKSVSQGEIYIFKYKR